MRERLERLFSQDHLAWFMKWVMIPVVTVDFLSVAYLGLWVMMHR